MKRICAKIMLAVALLGLALPTATFARGWETVKTEKPAAKRIISDNEIEIKTGGGTIYITTTRHLNVKIFTILGSRIADDNLAPGAYQYSVASHGVYIVQAGDLTCKVAV